MKGYVVVFEGDVDSGYSAYVPTCPGSSAPAPPVRRQSS